MVPEFPKFKDKYVVRHLPGQGVFLFSESGNFLLGGAHIEAVAPLLHGHLGRDEIAQQLSPAQSRVDTFSALASLYQQGHLEEQHQLALDPCHRTFWSELGVNPAIAIKQLARTKIGVARFGAVGTSQQLEDILISLGFSISTEPNFIIALADDYTHPGIEQLNRYCIAQRIPWMLVKSTGINLWVGPLFGPGAACWKCLRDRLKRNREFENYVERERPFDPPVVLSRARANFLEQQAIGMAVTQLLRFLAEGRSPLYSRILVAETLALNFSYHQVTKRPQCSACGDPKRVVGSKPLPLSSVSLIANADGGVRARSADETFAAYSHHISPITGVVTGVHSIASVGPIHVYSAGHNFALKNDSLYFLQDSLRVNSSGKGRTASQAMTSALCEALERYSGLFSGEEERFRSSFQSIGSKALHPNECMLYSARQYAQREMWLAKNSRFQVVPFEFDETVEMDWSPVFSLDGGDVRYLPTSYLYYGHPEQNGRFSAWADSNGCAAGSSREDAVLQGMLELVERDAVAIWWYNRIRRPKLDLSTFADPLWTELQRYYSSIGREFWVLDLTGDLRIPTFAAITRRTDAPVEDIVMGFGSHLDPTIAANRAISEMNQFMPAVLSRNPDGTTAYHFGDEDVLRWWRTETIAKQTYLEPNSKLSPTTASTYVSWSDRPILDQIGECSSRIRAVSSEIYVLDQTRPDIGLPVVKVIAPGMRHFWARFGPGRLYDVPVRLGWLDRPTPENDLNAIAMFV
ncbi:bacteriocin biosynthesis cyclodehydratase domain-containing protein [Bradyrhizobium sp. LB9.1b]